MTAEWCT